MKKTPRGAALAWFLAHVAYADDDCLIWPFARDRNGRGKLMIPGEQWAHRAMCRAAHGDPPTPTHQAAHSCGNGHGGCINPHHLSWKTPRQNSLDMRTHGTKARKPGCARYILTAAQVEEIRSLGDAKTQAELAEIFGVTWQNIGHVLRRETWNTSPYSVTGATK